MVNPNHFVRKYWSNQYFSAKDQEDDQETTVQDDYYEQFLVPGIFPKF